MKRFRVRFINEEAIMQSATVPSNVDTQEETTDDIAQETDFVANTTPTLQEQDVEGLEDKDVMNYVYFNAPQDIDDGTRQALFNRADQIRQKQMSGSTTPKDQEEFAKGVIAAASQTKNRAKLGESIDYTVQAWADAISGKNGKKGRNGSANWIGDNLYYEIDKDENDRIHYYNQWIGKVDRTKKILYINDEVAPSGTVQALIRAAHLINFTPKRTHETMELIDMGYDDEDFDPMYTEAYTSGRVDTFNEPSWEDMEGHYDQEDYNDYSSEEAPSIEELRQSSDELKRSTLLEDLKEAVADRIDDLSNGKYNYNRIYNVVDKYITNAHKKFNTKELEKYSRVSSGKVDFFAKIILMKYKNRF